MQYPTIEAWYERLKGDRKKYAQRLFGRIESLDLPDTEAKQELYKASMLATHLVHDSHARPPF